MWCCSKDCEGSCGLAAHLSCKGALDDARNHLSCLRSLQQIAIDLCETIASNKISYDRDTQAWESCHQACRQLRCHHYMVLQL